jgi:hypothetical protein
VLIDISGSIVHSVAIAMSPDGRFRQSLDAATLVRGVYVVRLTSAETVTTATLVVTGGE